jgi:DNA repair exonuclease SbcCD ATPase subunit
MIIFKYVKWKNFLSTGNSFTEIDLCQNKSTLVVGHNGSGKSTMLDAISFGLFGKPHRAIKKDQLVNSINKKSTIVEVEFSVGSSEYKIIRGIRPNVFEIWKDDYMINQSSHAKEYQKILEQNILKLNHKSFHQVVVLGSSSFIPFMQLPGGIRRDVIEDLLDINVFSKMNQLLKEKQSALKDNIKDTVYQLDLINNKIDTHKKYIKDVKVLTEQNVASKENGIQSRTKSINDLQKKSLELTKYIDQYQKENEKTLKDLHDKKQSFYQYKADFDSQMKRVVKDAKFYEDNTNCPTCSQSISDILRDEKLSAAKEKARNLTSAMNKLTEQSTKLEDNLSEANAISEKIRECMSGISTNSQTIEKLQKEIDSLKEDISTSAVADLQQAQQDLEDFNKTKESTLDQKLSLMEQSSYNGVMSEMLRDTGIKTKIIKQYLPVINKLVNQYLQVLDFFVHFNLDESFSETIRSRHRDEFTYDSFSEGEKQRIDLSLLFTWRHVAKMKNSVATNLLILDETFDSSLDHDGVENLLKILHTLDDNTNTFVISHKGDILDNKFENKIEFKKDKNFSRIA